MDDVISRYAAINVINRHWYTGTNLCEADATRREIIMLPSADAVEVVRCKDCIFYEKALSVQGFCHNHESIVSPNAFCSYGSYGKHREDGEA